MLSWRWPKRNDAIAGNEMTSVLQMVGEGLNNKLGVNDTAMLLETLASLKAAKREMSIANRNRHFLLAFEDGGEPSSLGVTMLRLSLRLEYMIERVEKQLAKNPEIVRRGLRVSEALMEHRKSMNNG